jgi:hypothetical protein
MSETNDSVEEPSQNTKTGINKYKKGVEEGEPDAIASAD